MTVKTDILERRRWSCEKSVFAGW